MSTFHSCTIGVEVAAALADKAKSVTIVDLVEAPFQLALGKEVGGAVKQVCPRCTVTISHILV